MAEETKVQETEVQQPTDAPVSAEGVLTMAREEDLAVPEGERTVRVEKEDIEGGVLDMAWTATYGFFNTWLAGNSAMFADKFAGKHGMNAGSVSAEEVYKTYEDVKDYVSLMKTDKQAALKKMQKEYKEASPEKKPMMAVSAAIADQTMTSFPQVTDEIRKDPISSAVYNATGVGMGIGKNVGLSMLTGGGSLALGAFQVADSGISMYNTMQEYKSISNDPNLNPMAYGVASGIATGLSFGLSEIVGRQVINKLFGEYMKSVVNRTVVGSMRNSGEYVAEHYIRNMGLAATDQEQMDFNAFGLGSAILFGGAFEMIRNTASLEKVKNNPEAYAKAKADLIEKASVLAAKETRTKAALDSVFGDTDKFSGRVKAKSRMLLQNVSEAEINKIQSAALEDMIDEVMDRSIESVDVDINTMISKMAQSNNIDADITASSKGIFAKERAEIAVAMTDLAVANVKTKLGDAASNENTLKNALQKEIRGPSTKIYSNYMDAITQGDYHDHADFVNKVHGRIDELNASDLTKQNIKTLFSEDNVDRFVHLQDVESRPTALATLAEEVDDVITSTRRYAVFSEVYRDVENIIGKGMYNLKPIDDLLEGKTMLSSDEFGKLAKQYGSFRNQYGRKTREAINKHVGQLYANSSVERLSSMYISEIKQKVDSMHGYAVDPNTRLAIEDLHATIDGLIPMDGNLQIKQNTYLRGLQKFAKRNNVDLVKAQKYLDTLDEAKMLKQDINMEEVELAGQARSYVATDISRSLEMSDMDIIAAHKIANFGERMYQIQQASQSKLPADYAGLISKLPDFDAEDGSFQGATYHPRFWNEEGTAVIKAKYGIDPDFDPKTKTYKPRSFTSTMSEFDDLRLAPIEAIEKHMMNTRNSMSYGSIYRQMEKTKLKHMGTAILDDAGNTKTMKEYYDQTLNDTYKNDPISLQLKDLEGHLDSLTASRKDYGTLVNTVDKGFGFTGDILAKWFISGVNVPFSLANVSQATQTLSPYLGFMNVAKFLPGAYGNLGRVIAKNVINKFDFEKVLRDEIMHAKANKSTVHWARYIEEAYSSGNVKNHYNSLSNKEIFIDAAGSANSFKHKAQQAAHAFQEFTDIFTSTLQASDFASRRPAFHAAVELVDKVVAKRLKGSSSIDSAVARREKLDADLHINTFGNVVSKKLRDSLSKSIKSGDFEEFKYQYGKAIVDVGIYQYGSLNKPAIYDKMKKFGSAASLTTRFSSWMLYDRLNNRKLLTSAFNIVDGKPTAQNLKPIMSSLAMIGTAVALKALVIDEMDKDNNIRRILDNYVVNRTVGIRTAKSIVGKVSDPTGMLDTTAKFLAYPFQKMMGKKVRNPFASISPERLAKIPTSDDAVELKDTIMKLDETVMEMLYGVEPTPFILKMRDSYDKVQQYMLEQNVIEKAAESAKKVQEQLGEKQEEILETLKEQEIIQ